MSLTSTWSAIRGFNRSVVLWLVTWALAAFGYWGLQGVLFNLYLLRLGFGPEFIGLLVGAGQLIWALAALPAAAVGGRVGLRAALLASFVFIGGGFGLLLLVELLPRPFWEAWLFSCWGIVWIGAALITVNTVPYAMAIVDDRSRNALFPVQSAVIALMTFVGSLVAGVLPGLLVGWIGGSLGEAAPYRVALSIMPLLFLGCVPVLAAARSVRPNETRAEETRAGLARLRHPLGRRHTQCHHRSGLPCGPQPLRLVRRTRRWARHPSSASSEMPCGSNDVAAAFTNLAAIRQRLGSAGEAEQLYRRAGPQRAGCRPIPCLFETRYL